MAFFNLFGHDVKSMYTVAGKKCLRLSKNREGFQFKDSKSILNKSDDYIQYDTGIKITPEIIDEMARISKEVSATKFKLRIQCIKGIEPLLKILGDEFTPKRMIDFIPSILLLKIHKYNG